MSSGEQRVYDALLYGYYHSHLGVEECWKEWKKDNPEPPASESAASNPVIQFDFDVNKYRNKNL